MIKKPVYTGNSGINTAAFKLYYGNSAYRYLIEINTDDYLPKTSFNYKAIEVMYKMIVGVCENKLCSTCVPTTFTISREKLRALRNDIETMPMEDVSDKVLLHLYTIILSKLGNGSQSGGKIGRFILPTTNSLEAILLDQHTAVINEILKYMQSSEKNITKMIELLNHLHEDIQERNKKPFFKRLFSKLFKKYFEVVFKSENNQVFTYNSNKIPYPSFENYDSFEITNGSKDMMACNKIFNIQKVQTNSRTRTRNCSKLNEDDITLGRSFDSYTNDEFEKDAIMVNGYCYNAENLLTNITSSKGSYDFQGLPKDQISPLINELINKIEQKKIIVDLSVFSPSEKQLFVENGCITNSNTIVLKDFLSYLVNDFKNDINKKNLDDIYKETSSYLFDLIGLMGYYLYTDDMFVKNRKRLFSIAAYCIEKIEWVFETLKLKDNQLMSLEVNGDSLKSILESLRSTCVHGVGNKLLCYYLSIYEVFKKTNNDIQLLPFIKDMEDSYVTMIRLDDSEPDNINMLYKKYIVVKFSKGRNKEGTTISNIECNKLFPKTSSDTQDDIQRYIKYSDTQSSFTDTPAIDKDLMRELFHRCSKFYYLKRVTFASFAQYVVYLVTNKEKADTVFENEIVYNTHKFDKNAHLNLTGKLKWRNDNKNITTSDTFSLTTFANLPYTSANNNNSAKPPIVLNPYTRHDLTEAFYYASVLSNVLYYDADLYKFNINNLISYIRMIHPYLQINDIINPDDGKKLILAYAFYTMIKYDPNVKYYKNYIDDIDKKLKNITDFSTLNLKKIDNLKQIYSTMLQDLVYVICPECKIYQNIEFNYNYISKNFLLLKYFDQKLKKINNAYIKSLDDQKDNMIRILNETFPYLDDTHKLPLLNEFGSNDFVYKESIPLSRYYLAMLGINHLYAFRMSAMFAKIELTGINNSVYKNLTLFNLAFNLNSIKIEVAKNLINKCSNMNYYDIKQEIVSIR